MDRRQLHKLSQSSYDSNGTATPLSLAPGMLETFIPGYGVISKFLLDFFGVDIGIFVSAGLLFVTFGTSLRFFWARLISFCSSYALSSVYFDEHDDELFPNVLDWIAEQNVGKNARNLKAVSKGRPRTSKVDEEEGTDVDPFKIFHVGRWIAKSPPRYEPYFGSYYFWHGARLFTFERSRREKQSRYPWDRQTDEEMIVLRTPGWSTAPIKELLKHIKGWAIERKKSFTVVNCPQSKDTRRYQGSWVAVTSRPSRPMTTIALDPKQKARIIADINEYLLPSSRRWYATHGIPYRRGYLFHGPPGTGKSSLCFALAGLFGLNIYIISLLDPALTESDLLLLFNHLPRRCVVLLEDIDSAGLNRDENETLSKKVEKEKKDDKDGEESAAAAADSTTETRRSRKRFGVNTEEPRAGISLSGLLNAVDGVASHEGRVLVMTTNYIENLDSALLRPGRVDMQVEFTLATKHQIREIFIRMYCNELSPAKGSEKIMSIPKDVPAKSKEHLYEKAPNGHVNQISSDIDEHLQCLLRKTEAKYSRLDLDQLADTFAEKVPDHTFSPAEVQNFLISRKKNPRKAVEDVELWRDELVKAKEKNTKVVSIN